MQVIEELKAQFIAKYSNNSNVGYYKLKWNFLTLKFAAERNAAHTRINSVYNNVDKLLHSIFSECNDDLSTDELNFRANNSTERSAHANNDNCVVVISGIVNYPLKINANVYLCNNVIFACKLECKCLVINFKYYMLSSIINFESNFSCKTARIHNNKINVLEYLALSNLTLNCTHVVFNDLFYNTFLFGITIIDYLNKILPNLIAVKSNLEFNPLINYWPEILYVIDHENICINISHPLFTQYNFNMYAETVCNDYLVVDINNFYANYKITKRID